MNRIPPKHGGGALASLALAMRSKRTASVVLQSFASGLPLGLVWYAIPDWMRDIGVDIRVVGLITLAQAPWTFKVIWSPLMDRYVPPFWGRRRGWMAVTQVALFALGLAAGRRRRSARGDLGGWRAGAGDRARLGVAGHRHRRVRGRGAAQGGAGRRGRARGLAFYRAALLVSGGVAITLAARIGWPAVNALLALVYLPMLVITWKSPEPEVQAPPPRTLRDAVWQPFLELPRRARARSRSWPSSCSTSSPTSSRRR